MPFLVPELQGKIKAGRILFSSSSLLGSTAFHPPLALKVYLSLIYIFTKTLSLCPQHIFMRMNVGRLLCWVYYFTTVVWLSTEKKEMTVHQNGGTLGRNITSNHTFTGGHWGGQGIHRYLCFCLFPCRFLSSPLSGFMISSFVHCLLLLNVASGCCINAKQQSKAVLWVTHCTCPSVSSGEK